MCMIINLYEKRLAKLHSVDAKWLPGIVPIAEINHNVVNMTIEVECYQRLTKYIDTQYIPFETEGVHINLIRKKYLGDNIYSMWSGFCNSASLLQK